VKVNKHPDTQNCKPNSKDDIHGLVFQSTNDIIPAKRKPMKVIEVVRNTAGEAQVPTTKDIRKHPIQKDMLAQRNSQTKLGTFLINFIADSKEEGMLLPTRRLQVD
jgi:hypothetical protein